MCGAREKVELNGLWVALALFWGQLEAKAFQEEYDVNSFNDLTAPQWDSIHKVRSCSA